MAVSVPDAFGGRGVAFAGAYVANQVGRPLVLALALRGHKRQAIPLRIFCWAAVSAVPWLTGAIFFQGGARGLVWALALALDYAGAMLGWPTPGLGRSRISNWEVAIKHLAERYQQLLIIALGESILLLGLTFTQNFAADRAAAFAMAFATTVLLWRIYFHRAGTVLADAIASAPEPGRLGQAVGYTHLVMVASILLTGVGYELVIEHPLGHPRPGWLTVILGGPALFLAARSRFEYDVFGRVSRSRIIALIALAALAPATFSLPPLIATTAATAVLAAVATSDAIRARKGPPEAPSPPR
jgi:low temperature requirement protein LtrA